LFELLSGGKCGADRATRMPAVRQRVSEPTGAGAHRERVAASKGRSGAPVGRQHSQPTLAALEQDTACDLVKVSRDALPFAPEASVDGNVNATKQVRQFVKDLAVTPCLVVASGATGGLRKRRVLDLLVEIAAHVMVREGRRDIVDSRCCRMG
jgi:hypothetical protein